MVVIDKNEPFDLINYYWLRLDQNENLAIELFFEDDDIGLGCGQNMNIFFICMAYT